MTDYDRRIEPGDEQIVRRPPRPATGKWNRRTTIRLADGDTVRLTTGDVAPPPPPPDDPTDPPPPIPSMRGFGRSAKGGTKLAPVSTRDDFLAAAKQGGNLVRVNNDLELGGQWSCAPETTVDFQWHQLARAWLWGKLEHVQLLNGEVVASEDIGSANDIDVMTLKAGWHDVYCRNMTFAGAPDVLVVVEGGENLTLDRCLLAYGLLRSEHDQSGDTDGHSLGFNMRDVGTGPKRGVSVIESAQMHTQGRFQIRGPWSEVELVQLVMYNYGEAPQVSDATSVHFIDPIYVKGPEPELSKAGAFEPYVVVERLSSKAGSVYVAGHRAEGFAFRAVSDTPSMLSTSPLFAGTPSAKLPLDTLLSVIGGRGVVTERALAAARARTGQWENGADGPAPVFKW